MRVTFEMFGETQFSREIVRVGARAGDASPVFRAIRDDWMDWNKSQFESEGARASGGWDALAASTVQRKGHDRILFDSGALLDELTNPSNVLITPNFMHLQLPDSEGDPGHYGPFHQTGTSRMPRRRPLEFTGRDRTDMTKRLQLWIIKGVVA